MFLRKDHPQTVLLCEIWLYYWSQEPNVNLPDVKRHHPIQTSTHLSKGTAALDFYRLLIAQLFLSLNALKYG